MSQINPHLNKKKAGEADFLKEINRIADSVVSRYVARSAIPYREREDVKMAVLEKFLDKKEQILNAFEGKSKLTTYLIAVINRMCCEVIRKEKKHWYAFVDDSDGMYAQKECTTVYETSKKLLFKEEVQRLSNTMQFFNGSCAKVNLFLKLLFNIPITSKDIELYSPDKADMIKEFFIDVDNSKKTELFEKMAHAQNIVENKNVGGDAVRIWLTKQIQTILQRLNGNEMSSHDKESLAVLFEMKENMQHNN